MYHWTNVREKTKPQIVAGNTLLMLYFAASFSPTLGAQERGPASVAVAAGRSLYLSVSIYLSIYLSICLSVCLSFLSLSLSALCCFHVVTRA